MSFVDIIWGGGSIRGKTRSRMRWLPGWIGVGEEGEGDDRKGVRRTGVVLCGWGLLDSPETGMRKEATEGWRGDTGDNPQRWTSQTEVVEHSYQFSSTFFSGDRRRLAGPGDISNLERRGNEEVEGHI